MLLRGEEMKFNKESVSLVKNINNISKVSVAFAFVLLLFAFLSFSHALNVEDYLASTESPSSIVLTNYTSGSDVYTFVSIASKDSMILKNGEIIKNMDEIKKALNARCFNSSRLSSSQLDSIKTNVLALNSSRQAKTVFGGLEDFCDSIVGQSGPNEGNCTNSDNCLTACRGGSISCFNLAMYGVGFLDALLDYANIKRAFDGNVSSVLNTVNNLDSFSGNNAKEFLEKINELNNSISNLRNLTTRYENNGLVSQSGFKFCLPPNYVFRLNSTALNSLVSTSSQISNNAQCFDSVNSNAESIYNETFRRIDLYVSTKAKVNLQNQFNNISEKYNSLTEKATSILSYVDDSKIKEYISGIESLNQAFYSNMSKNEIDQAGYVLSVIQIRIDEFDSYLRSTYSLFDELQANKEKVESLLVKASVLISPSDSPFYADYVSFSEQYVKLNKKMSEKVDYAELQNYNSQYSSLATKLEELIERKKTAETETVPSALSESMQGISSTVLDSFSGPLGIKEDEKRAWAKNIPLIVIAFVDIIVLVIFSLAFFFLVLRNTSAFAKSKVMNSWILIFGVVILLLALISYALYTAIGNEISSASLYKFMSKAEQNGKVYIFTEYLSSDNSTAISKCADKIAAALQMKGIEVEKIEVVDGICKNTLLSECLSETDKQPIIQLAYSQENDSKFYTFYRPEGIITGDASYLDKCYVANFIE
jgi:hypothetical protein